MSVAKKNVNHLLDPNRLEEDAIYLGVLTAMGVKPLSRLEYGVAPDVLSLLRGLGLKVVPVKRVVQDGSEVIHWILGRDSGLIEQYKSDFDGSPIREGDPEVIRAEARYFGFPACCAEAYIRDPLAPGTLTTEEQGLLFHRACPGCKETPKLIPLYRSALREARRLHKALRFSRSAVCRLIPRILSPLFNLP